MKSAVKNPKKPSQVEDGLQPVTAIELAIAIACFNTDTRFRFVCSRNLYLMEHAYIQAILNGHPGYNWEKKQCQKSYYQYQLLIWFNNTHRQK